MEKITLVLLFASALLWGGCQHDKGDAPEPVADTGTLKLMMNPHWDGQLLDDSTTHVNVQGYRVNLDLLNVYIGDLKLGSNTIVSRIELFKLINGSRERELKVAPAVYSGLEFGIGVPQDLNNADPVSFPPDSPLHLNEGTHWGMINYRFVMIDGFTDTTGVVGAPLDYNFSLHSGRDVNYREFFTAQSVNITKDSTTVLTVNLDVSKFFYNATDTVDLATPERFLHGSNGQENLNENFSNNVLSSISVTQ